MIRQLWFWLARFLFGAGVIVGIAAVALVYLSYRLLRKVTVGDRPVPVREAAFATLVSAVALAKAVQAESERSR